VLKEANASALVVDTREELAGMSDKAIDAAAAEAKKRGLDGKFVIPVVNTTGQANLAVLTNRAPRAPAGDVAGARQPRRRIRQPQVVLELAKLRAERAALLGYPSFAAYIAGRPDREDRAPSTSCWPNSPSRPSNNAKKEAAEIQKVIDAEKGGFRWPPHDWNYYSDKVRAERYNFDQNQLKPLLRTEQCADQRRVLRRQQGLRPDLQGAQGPAGVRPGRARVRRVRRRRQAAGDLHRRLLRARNKRGGAWMNAYVSQSSLMGTHPVVANHLNIPEAAGRRADPADLRRSAHHVPRVRPRAARHVLEREVPALLRHPVPRDFVEFPSQVNEMWSDNPEVLANYAKHYQTGAPMPKELLDKVQASAKFNEGFRTTEYLAASILDQKWHQLGAAQIPTDVLGFERRPR
jgi:peptidyl-dipeptidase Dcp